MDLLFDLDKKDFTNIVIVKTMKDVEGLDKKNHILTLTNKAIKLYSYQDGLYNFYTFENIEKPFLSFAIKHHKKTNSYKLFYINIDI